MRSTGAFMKRFAVALQKLQNLVLAPDDHRIATAQRDHVEAVVECRMDVALSRRLVEHQVSNYLLDGPCRGMHACLGPIPLARAADVRWCRLRPAC